MSRGRRRRSGPEVIGRRRDGLRGHGATGVVFLRAQHKGRTYKATLHKDGRVKVGGTLYPSLSAAGQAVTKRSTNGRTFWRVRTADGSWVSIGSLEV